MMLQIPTSREKLDFKIACIPFWWFDALDEFDLWEQLTARNTTIKHVARMDNTEFLDYIFDPGRIIAVYSTIEFEKRILEEGLNEQ